MEFAEEQYDIRAEEMEEYIMICIENSLPLARIWKLPGFQKVYIGQ